MPLAHRIGSVDFSFACSKKTTKRSHEHQQRRDRYSHRRRDVPGLNPAIRAVTIRALREGYQVVGIRHAGWARSASCVTNTPTIASIFKS